MADEVKIERLFVERVNDEKRNSTWYEGIAPAALVSGQMYRVDGKNSRWLRVEDAGVTLPEGIVGIFKGVSKAIGVTALATNADGNLQVRKLTDAEKAKYNAMLYPGSVTPDEAPTMALEMQNAVTKFEKLLAQQVTFSPQWDLELPSLPLAMYHNRNNPQFSISVDGDFLEIPRGGPDGNDIRIRFSDLTKKTYKLKSEDERSLRTHTLEEYETDDGTVFQRYTTNNPEAGEKEVLSKTIRGERVYYQYTEENIPEKDETQFKEVVFTASLERAPDGTIVSLLNGNNFDFASMNGVEFRDSAWKEQMAREETAEDNSLVDFMAEESDSDIRLVDDADHSLGEDDLGVREIDPVTLIPYSPEMWDAIAAQSSVLWDADWQERGRFDKEIYLRTSKHGENLVILKGTGGGQDLTLHFDEVVATHARALVDGKNYVRERYETTDGTDTVFEVIKNYSNYDDVPERERIAEMRTYGNGFFHYERYEGGVLIHSVTLEENQHTIKQTINGRVSTIPVNLSGADQSPDLEDFSGDEPSLILASDVPATAPQQRGGFVVPPPPPPPPPSVQPIMQTPAQAPAVPEAQQQPPVELKKYWSEKSDLGLAAATAGQVFYKALKQSPTARGNGVVRTGEDWGAFGAVADWGRDTAYKSFDRLADSGSAFTVAGGALVALTTVGTMLSGVGFVALAAGATGLAIKAARSKAEGNDFKALKNNTSGIDKVVVGTSAVVGVGYVAASAVGMAVAPAALIGGLTIAGTVIGLSYAMDGVAAKVIGAGEKAVQDFNESKTALQRLRDAAYKKRVTEAQNGSHNQP